MNDDLSNWQAMSDSEFIQLVGPIEYRTNLNGFLEFRFTAAEKHGNRGGYVHGGMLMTFADRALGMSARQHDLGRAQATVQFNMQFLAPGRVGDIIEMNTRVVRATSNLVFVDGSVRNREEVLGVASGIWKVIKS